MGTIVAAMAMNLGLLSAADADFRSGAAVRAITPEPLLPVSGGVGPAKPTREKRGDLTVRALVLEGGGVRAAIVGADLLGFPSQLGNRVRRRVEGIPPENIIITATHTHSAPDVYGFPGEDGRPGCDMEYIELVCARMAEAIQEAASRLRPARVRIATGEARGRIAYNYYAPDLYDPRCSVIQPVGVDGKAIATLVNYAIHPEVLGNSRGILSPDLCGPLYDRIEARGGGTAIFVNGALGGMVTADNRDPSDPSGKRQLGTWEECVRIGELLADEALRIVAGAPLVADPALHSAAATVSFPVDSPLLKGLVDFSPILSEMRRDGDRVETRVNILNLADAQILTIPGEALPNVGYYLKRKMHGRHNLLFGLGNDAFGYLMTKVDWGSFQRYEYISRTCLGETAGEIFIEEALRLADRCPRPPR